jgi:hypothetical protein
MPVNPRLRLALRVCQGLQLIPSGRLSALNTQRLTVLGDSQLDVGLRNTQAHHTVIAS